MNQTKLLSRNDCLFLLTLVSVFIYISRLNYVLFHSLVEISIFTFGFLTFAFAWHLRRFNLGSLLAVGILVGCSGIMSVFHMLAYKGMGVFTNDPNVPTQLWIASRYMFSVVLMVAFAFSKKNFNPHILLISLFTLTLALLAFVFSGHFPECFNPDTGLTPFKIISEYIISGFIIVAAVLFWRKRSSYPKHIIWPLVLFFSFSILTELVFTSYLGVYDFSNMVGHLFQFLSFYLFYKAIVETGLERPFDLLFKSLNEAVKTRDEFISMASHELKTPLTPLKLQLQMFQREIQTLASDKETQLRFTKVARSTNEQFDRLNRLIDGMLDVSKLSTGQFEIFKMEMDLSPLIINIARSHESQINSTQSNVKLSLEPLRVEVDPMRIEQVITNLLMNALKYAPGSDIEIGMARTSDGKSKIWVKDNGPGISQEAQTRIFNRYERDTNSTVGGLGLGLYISRQIIEAHGGTLSVESEEDKGSTFRIII